MAEITIEPIDPMMVLPLFGAKDQHLRRLQDCFGVKIVHNSGRVVVSGESEPVEQAADSLRRLKKYIEKHGNLSPEIFEKTVAQASGKQDESKPAVWGSAAESIETNQVHRPVKPRSPGQADYVEKIRHHDMVFSMGPAGSGKTFLAVAMAVEALKQRRIRRLVLVRPAVEAGESLGYLPGDLSAKIHPYLRPLLDAIFDMLGQETANRMMENQTIEVLPLAYMRGRTLNDAFIILDEAQNTTIAQMKMFLTRMGANSKIVVAGDTTQIDLPRNTGSGLFDAIRKLEKVKGVAVSRLGKGDIVRHPLVQKVVDAYDKSDHSTGSDRGSDSK